MWEFSTFGYRVPTSMHRLAQNFVRRSGPIVPSATPNFMWIGATSRPCRATMLIFRLWVNLILAVCRFSAILPENTITALSYSMPGYQPVNLWSYSRISLHNTTDKLQSNSTGQVRNGVWPSLGNLFHLPAQMYVLCSVKHAPPINLSHSACSLQQTKHPCLTDQWHVKHSVPRCPLSARCLHLACWKWYVNKLYGRPPQYAPTPCDTDLWPSELESGVQVTCDVSYLCANVSLSRPLFSRLRPDVRDRQTDRQTDRRQTPSSLT